MGKKQENKPGWREIYPFESNFIAVGDDLRCHYLDCGSGFPAVMIHGNPTWSFYYRELIKILSGEHRCIALDNIGCGLSDKPQNYPYDLEHHIRNLEKLVIDELQLPQLDLIMHDWGGAIATGFATRHPERVRRMVVMNTAAFLFPTCPLRIRACRWPYVGSFIVRRLNAFLLASLFMGTAKRQKVFTSTVREGYLAPYGCSLDRVAISRFVRDIPLERSHPTRKVLSEIETCLPLLSQKKIFLAWGAKDFCFHLKFRDRWKEFFPEAQMKTFKDAGHFVLEDAAEELLPMIKDFLS